MKDCDMCPRQHACDEVALEVRLDQQHVIPSVNVA